MDSALTNQKINGLTLLQVFQAAAAWFTHNVAAINALNVFPVPDGDTGTNMNLTLTAALKDVQPDPSVAVVAERIYRGALMGARGNSGVILSQILRGLSQGLANQAECTPEIFVQALEQASATAYKAVIKPVEGTMLTVIRETSEAARAIYTPEIDWVTLLSGTLQGARASVDRTPTLMKLLRDAGVVDAGGEGLYVLFEGATAFVRGEQLERTASATDQFAMAFEDIHSEDDFGYCTNFMIEGANIPYEDVRQTLADMGTSVVAVGDEQLMKVHIHLLRPGDALNYAVQWGSLSAIEITNMDHQRRDLHAAAAMPLASAKSNEPVNELGVVAVAPGEGFRRIFHSLNVGAVVTGGQTMNPSIQDLVDAIDGLPQQVVVVLPNNSNIILAAQQAQQLTTKQVQVVPTKTVPQGMAAIFALNYAVSIEENVAAMQRAIRDVATAEITTAVRDATVNDLAVRSGQTIGLLDGKLVESGDDPNEVISQVLSRMELADHEILTIYYGEQCSAKKAEALAAQITVRYPELGVEVQSGGQPFYDYILSAE
ncbi:MAG: DAK2 domain-containing protein [Herpetosiphonaceae bacterium]|nr:DAK2 domain-containing protein [Herpetosiphonaceae bacterium]